MMKKAVAIATILVLWLVLSVQCAPCAAVTEIPTSTGRIPPGHILYRLEIAKENIHEILAGLPVIGSTDERIGLKAEHAEERIAEARAMAEKFNYKAMQRAIDEYEKEIGSIDRECERGGATQAGLSIVRGSHNRAQRTLEFILYGMNATEESRFGLETVIQATIQKNYRLDYIAQRKGIELEILRLPRYPKEEVSICMQLLKEIEPDLHLGEDVNIQANIGLLVQQMELKRLIGDEVQVVVVMPNGTQTVLLRKYVLHINADDNTIRFEMLGNESLPKIYVTAWDMQEMAGVTADKTVTLMELLGFRSFFLDRYIPSPDEYWVTRRPS